jgi:hypothetical protein
MSSRFGRKIPRFELAGTFADRCVGFAARAANTRIFVIWLNVPQATDEKAN